MGQGEKKAIETGNAYYDTCIFVFFRNALSYYLEMLSLRMNEAHSLAANMSFYSCSIEI